MGYSPWGRKESDMTEHAHTSFCGYVWTAVIFSCCFNSDSEMPWFTWVCSLLGLQVKAEVSFLPSHIQEYLSFLFLCSVQ